jgi:hypothetical protein
VREKNLRAVIVEPNKPARIEKVPNDIYALQKLVGGLVEHLDMDGFDLLFNEEGKLLDLEPNFSIFDGLDYIAGICIFVGVNYSTGEWTSLKDEHLSIIMANFNERE